MQAVPSTFAAARGMFTAEQQTLINNCLTSLDEIYCYACDNAGHPEKGCPYLTGLKEKSKMYPSVSSLLK